MIGWTCHKLLHLILWLEWVFTMKRGNCLLYSVGAFVRSGCRGRVRVKKNKRSRAGCTFYHELNGVKTSYTSSPKGNGHKFFFKGKKVIIK